MSILDITVAKVAAVISAGVTIIQFTFALSLVIILVYLMKNNNSPSTWSVFVRSLHYSSWPALLSSDASNTDHADRPVKRIDLLTTIIMVLSTITGVITPLGLVPAFRQDPSDLQLYPVKNVNPLLSIPVTSRANYSEGRLCAGPLDIPTACPGQTLVNVTGQQYLQTNLGIPQNITTKFSSTNYSNPFEMQYRRYVLTNSKYNTTGLAPKPSISISNSVVLRDKLFAIPGLIVDTTDTPGIGIGNIQVPQLPYGATWEQQMLWIEPVTSCINLNFTLNYQLDKTAKIESTFGLGQNISITDQGGLEINVYAYPTIGRNGQEVTMDERANKLAFLTLFYLKTQWNITLAKAGVGKNFPITQTGNIKLHQTGFYSPADVAGLLPFNVSLGNDTTAFDTLCQGFSGADQANITNTAVQCGILIGGPSRTDGGDNQLNDAFSSWQQPIYSCASTVRAKLQTLTVSFNSSTANSSLTLSDLNLSRRDTNTSILWGMEATGLPILGINPYWGPVDNQYQNDPSLYTLQAESFYLPADSAFIINSGDSFGQASSLPMYALRQSMVTDGVTINYDYSGSSNAALLQLWHNLSSSAPTASRISNLIWTDIVANNLYSNVSIQSSMVLKNIPSVGYNLLYAIPAFIMLVAWLAVVICAIVFFVTDRVSIHTIRQALYQTSLGRVVINISTFSPNFSKSTEEWVERESDTAIGLNVTAKLEANHIRFQLVPETSSLWQVLNQSKPSKWKNQSQTEISDPMELHPLGHDSDKK